MRLFLYSKLATSSRVRRLVGHQGGKVLFLIRIIFQVASVMHATFRRQLLKNSRMGSPLPFMTVLRRVVLHKRGAEIVTSE